MSTASDKEEVLRGHFGECLNHFSSVFLLKIPRGTKRYQHAREAIADFCGATTDTVSNWICSGDKKVKPHGERFLRFNFLLDMLGYRIIEIERMSKVVKNFAELIGYGLVTPAEATTFLGYSTVDNIYRVVFNGGSLSDDKKQKMWELWKENKEKLELKKNAETEKISKKLGLFLKSEGVNNISGEEKPASSSSRTDAIVKIADGLLSLLVDDSVGLTELELKKLEQNSVNIILRLSASLSSMSSKLIIQNQKKGG